MAQICRAVVVSEGAKLYRHRPTLVNWWWLAAWLVFVGASPVPARAQLSPSQIPENVPPDAPFQLGPFYVTPTFELRDVGVDPNVFNDESEERAWTATPSTTIQSTALAGPFRLATNLTADYLWYQSFAAERSLNTNVAARLEAYLDRIRPWASAGWLRTRARRGFEIDARAPRRTPSFGTGVDWVLGSRTSIATSAQFQRSEYADTATFAGVSLADQLNGDETSYRAGLVFDVTPLTAFRVDGERRTARFLEGSVRDNASWAVLPSLVFQPGAALSGSVIVGYRSFAPTNLELEGFNGVEVNTTAAINVRETTQVAIEGSRGIEYSFEELHPYYLQTGGRVQVLQRVGGPVEVTLMGAIYELAFRDLPGDPQGPRGSQRLRLAGIGVGYRLSETVRLSLNAQSEKRRSVARPNRDYDRMFYYGSIAYTP